MVVVNDPANLAPRILVVKLKKVTKMFTFILDSFSKKGRNSGVKRNNYYLFTVDSLYVTPVLEISKEHTIFMRLVQHADLLHYAYLMIVNP